MHEHEQKNKNNLRLYIDNLSSYFPIQNIYIGVKIIMHT